MPVKMPAISPKRFQGVHDFHADLLSAVARRDQELKKDNHGNKDYLACITKAEEHKNYWHKNNFWNRVTEIDKGGEKSIEPLVTPKKKAYRHGKNESKEQTCEDTEQARRHMAPEKALIKL